MKSAEHIEADIPPVLSGADPRSVLHHVFGYSAFRPGQERIIEHLLAGEHVLAVMPTGGGKSLCYQIPAILSDGVTVIVSPLVALMDDQVAALNANGVAAVGIHSGMDREVQLEAWEAVKRGEVKIVYMSPERLMSGRMLAALGELKIAMFIIDEAHCVSKWGVSFRPEYEMLSQLKERFSGVTFGAFTATADAATREDIARKLFPDSGTTIVQGFDRPNLKLAAAPKNAWRGQLLDFLADKGGESGIVYCLSRKFTEEVAAFLSGEGFNAIAYHAGQDAAARKTGQDRFMSEDAVIMVATIAFGMGIDKPDIRYVCHLNLPGSVEAYYQEIGRAGRDGAPAETLMLYGLDDIRMRRMFIDDDGEDQEHKRREHKRLDALLAYCEAPSCRRKALLAYFDEEIEACGNCDNCIDPPTLVDGTRHAQMLLSAVYRTGQVFGTAHVIDVVRGAETQKILERGHDSLPTFGVGADQSKQYWQAFVRQLVAGGALSINIRRYGCLEITEEGADILRGKRGFEFRDPQITTKRDRRKKRSPIAAATLSTADDELLTKLKALRLELAREKNVPAYVIFPDATLIEMASEHPLDLEALAEINGVGPKKLGEYGAQFLQVIEDEIG
ncbi:DNA helicase RecQ [Hoeflea prorocentri]|uniref:DNA helicase RecQ n=1 Tax=Hoeflea prorocentri TaxID=1922333 RepID=A0A9X3UK55_9HYPH|nr:DNA helicase RecQ [Hoeflea prorocentri]MCY6382149.1 DNA helicase RecQ [Hoeflea prorocentri]MDA5399949.1 DNA helicase RecQ [Hoeflea prorocentri]